MREKTFEDLKVSVDSSINLPNDRSAKKLFIEQFSLSKEEAKRPFTPKTIRATKRLLKDFGIEKFDIPEDVKTNAQLDRWRNKIISEYLASC